MRQNDCLEEAAVLTVIPKPNSKPGDTHVHEVSEGPSTNEKQRFSSQRVRDEEEEHVFMLRLIGVDEDQVSWGRAGVP